MKDLGKYSFALLLICSFFPLQAGSGFRIENPRCEYLSNPLGIDKEYPRFSWIIETSDRNITQSAYQIIVTREDSLFHHTVWDSGKVTSSDSWNIHYSGQALTGQTTYYWKAKVWDQNGHESAWSSFQLFHTGFLDQENFNAHWIMSPDRENRSPLFRKSFNLTKPLKSAYVYATAIGLYELYINGMKADSRLFEPAVTQFTERVLYSVYDITESLYQSVNTLGIWMGEGSSAFTDPPANRFANVNMKPSSFPGPMLCLEVRLNYIDGSSETISSDTNWKCSSSALTFNNFYGGEDYDARLEQNGWASAWFDDTHWRNAVRGHYDGKISAQLLPPVQERSVHFPLSSVKRDNHILDFDFGTTIGGYWEIQLEGEKGDFVVIRGTEKCGGDSCQRPLTPETTLYWEDNHTQRYYSRDCYSKFTLSGKGTETYKPRFFYHGFRYLQVHLSNPEIRIKSIKIIGTGNSIEEHGEFISSDPHLNCPHRIINQTFKNNIIQGVPLSNPNSEKYGWTGDVHLFSEAANYNFYLPAFWSKWMQDFSDAQKWAGKTGIIPVTVPELRKRPARNDVSWMAAYPIIVWQMYRLYHDRQIIREHYPSLKKWHQFVSGATKENIAGGIYGDHLIPGIHKQTNFSTPEMLRLINTAYWFRVTCLLEKMASLAGEEEDAIQFGSNSEKIFEAFNNQFYNEEKKIYLENISSDGFLYELTSNLISLQMKLVPPDKKERITGFIKDELQSNNYRMFTGVLGTKAVVDFFQEEDPGFLYKIVQNRDYPGWGYLLDSLDASTLNQQWDGKGDFNHAMFGSIDSYFFRTILGIQLDDAVVNRQITISPFLPDDLDYAGGKTYSVFGTVSSYWKKSTEGINYMIGIPANSEGVFRFKTSSNNYKLYVDDLLLIKDNDPMASPEWLKSFWLDLDTDTKCLTFGSGNYRISINENHRR